MRRLALLLALFTSASSLAQGRYAHVATTHALTAADDYKLGHGYVQSFVWSHGHLDDAKQQGRVEGLMRRIIAASDRPDLIFDVSLVDDETLNAAAFPGGFMMVTRGALEAFSDEQLAFVLAHEVSHVLLRHNNVRDNLNAAMRSLDDMTQARDDGDRERAGEAAKDLRRMIASYQRQHELEADIYGLLYAIRAGFTSESGVSSMELLKARVGEVPSWYREFASHPTFSDRIDELRSGTASIRATHGQFDVGLALYEAGRHEAAVRAFQEYLTLFPHSSAGWTNLCATWLRASLRAERDPWVDDLPVRQGSELSVRGDDNLPRERARDACTRAVGLDPNHPEALGLLTVLARRDGDLDAASVFGASALVLRPGDAALLNNLGNVRASEGRLDQAVELYERALDAGAAPHVRANRARALSQLGKKKRALEAWAALEADPDWGEAAALGIEALGGHPKKERRDEREARRAKQAASDPQTLDGVGLGASQVQVIAAWGEPEWADADADELYSYATWPGRAAVFLLDGAVTLTVRAPAKGRVAGVALGDTGQAVHKALGPADAVTQAGALVRRWYASRSLVLIFGADHAVMSMSLLVESE